MLTKLFKTLLISLIMTSSIDVNADETICSNLIDTNSLEPLLKHHYPDWKIVDINDLRHTDRVIWHETHPNQCPGIALGRYYDNGIISYAITMFKTSPELKQTLIVVTANGTNKFKIDTLSEEQSVAYLSVVYRQPPNKYSSIEGHNINLTRDSIVYDAIEAGAIAFYYDGKVFHSLVTSE